MENDILNLLTAAEAAGLFRISLSTIYRLLRARAFPYFRIGHQILIDRQELLKAFHREALEREDRQ